MAIDDHPIDALKHQLELEDGSSWPLGKNLVKAASAIPVPPLLGEALRLIKVRFDGDTQHRIEVMLETCAEQIKRQDNGLRALEEQLSPGQLQRRGQETMELVVDAARRASITRSLERVKRIGLILANSVLDPSPIDSDDVEEMMRVAIGVNPKSETGS